MNLAFGCLYQIYFSLILFIITVHQEWNGGEVFDEIPFWD